MAKRFIDTGYYKSPFVRGLQGPLKALYSFIICDCSGAGIWCKDLEIAGLYIGFKISEADWKVFVDSGKAIEVGPGRFFFPDFIDHQYPGGLSEKNPAHKNFLDELLKFNVLEPDDKGAFKPLQRPSKGSKVMVKVMVEETVEVKETVTREKKTPDVVMPFDTTTFAETWQIWKKYRQEIRKPYKGAVSEQAALKKLSGYDEATAIKMLHQSMENGWTGIFELKTQTHGKQTSTQSDEWAEYKRDLAERVKQYSGGADGRHTPG